MAPTYGQLDWSARAICGNYLGWFDGRPETLYPLAPAETAAREVGLMGGPERVLELARAALEAKDPRWALHLLAKLSKSGLVQGEAAKRTGGGPDHGQHQRPGLSIGDGLGAERGQARRGPARAPGRAGRENEAEARQLQ